MIRKRLIARWIQIFEKLCGTEFRHGPALRRFTHQRRRFLPKSAIIETLEDRIAPALLAPGADAEAFARFFADADGPNQASDPVQADVSAAAGTILPIFGTMFQTSAHANAQASGMLLSQSKAGGADGTPAPPTPTDTQANSSLQGVSNWIVTGLPAGQQVSIDIALTVSGMFEIYPNDPAIQPSDIHASVASSLVLASDSFSANQTLFNASADLDRQITVNGPWSFTDTSTGSFIRYETSYTDVVSFTVGALEPFSLSANLSTDAATANAFEWFATADFETPGGFSYTLSTSAPGAQIDPFNGAPPPVSDTDGDGIDDVVEDAGPNGGDADGDGTLDSQQATVATYFDSYVGDYVTLVLCPAAGEMLPPNAGFANVREASTPPPATLDVLAAYEANVVGVDPGESVIVKVLRASGSDGVSYYHFGTEPADRTTHWFEFPLDGTSGGAVDEMDKMRVNVHVTDGGAGDGDDLADGSFFVSGAVAANRPGPTRIVGVKFVDSNGNGIQDPGEPQLAGWPIYLDDNQNGQLDEATERLTFTNDAGEFAFLDVEHRSYTVAEGSQFGFLQTAPAPFYDPIDIPNLGTVRSTASGDFNGDGRIDLVVPNDHETVVLLNQGGGRFVESARLQGLGSDEAAVVGDFDGDHRLDLAIAYTLADRVGIWLGNGNGTFRLESNTPYHSVGQEPYGILAVDLVGDSNVDLVTVNFLSADITILAGRGDGGFDPHSTLSAGTTIGFSAVADDFDANGFIDLAVANPFSEELILFWNEGGGTFTTQAMTVAGIGSHLVAGQFNTGFLGDQDLDLAVTANGAIVALFGDGQRGFLDVRVVPSAGGSPNSLAAVDFDQDGHTDLIASVPANDTVAFFRQEQTIELGVLRPDFVPAGTTPVAAGSLYLGTALLDSDSVPDLIVASSTDERVQVLSGNPFRHQRVRAGELDDNGRAFVPFGNAIRDGGEIRGTIWKDLNANGVRDVSTPTTPADPPLPFQLVYIDLDGNGILDTRLEPFQFSDTEGRYAFLGLPADDYTVRVSPLTNWAQTFPASGVYSITLPARQTVTNIDFGIAPPGEIRGSVYLDSNRNGQRDPGEPPLVGWQVFLDDGNGVFDLGEFDTTTDLEGNYEFLDLPPGTYHVAQTIPEGWDTTVTATQVIELAQAEIQEGIDFIGRGVLQIPGVVWDDENANGIFELGEDPISGRTVFLDFNGNLLLDDGEIATQSDSQGVYELLVPPGTHRVVQTLPDTPSQFVQTFPATPSHIVLAEPGRLPIPFNFGSRIPNDIRGFVRIDQNGNGSFDPGEAGLAGATVYVDLNHNRRFDVGEPTSETDVIGGYVFLNQRGSIGLLPEEPWLQINPLVKPGILYSDLETHSHLANMLVNLNPDVDSYLDYVLESLDRDQIFYRLNTGPARILGESRVIGVPADFGRDRFDQAIDQVFVGNVNSDGNPDFLVSTAGRFLHDGRVRDEIRLFSALGDGLGGFPTTLQPIATILPSRVTGAYSTDIADVLIGQLNPETDDIPDLVLLEFVEYQDDTKEHRLYTIFGSRDGNGNLIFEAQADFDGNQFIDEEGHFDAGANYIASPQLTTNDQFEPDLLIDGLADVNGDQRPEIVLKLNRTLHLPEADNVQFWTQEGQRLSQIGLLHHPEVIVYADLNQDGNLDVVVSGGGGAQTTFCDPITNPDCTPVTKVNVVAVTFLTGDGTGQFTSQSQVLPGYGSTAESGLVGDIDSDGRTDLLIDNTLLLATDTPTPYRIGNQSFQAIGSPIDPFLGESAGLADVDNDGQVDLVTSVTVVPGPLFRPSTASPSNPGRTDYDFLVTLLPDHDTDGVSSRTEDLAPNDGDGNGDGMPDRDQMNVASIPNAVDGSYLTIVSPQGTRLVDVRVEANPDPANSPPGVQFPFGFVHFTVEGVSPGATIPVQIILQGGVPNDFYTYYKYGPTPNNSADHFYPFAPVPVLPFNTIYLDLTDGGIGDADRMPNGAIVDPGAPAIVEDRILVTGAGPGGGPHVRVFDGADGSERFSFFAYDPNFAGGVRVATGDVNGDGVSDVITGAGPGGGPHVKVFDGTTGDEIRSFFAFDDGFRGGVFVAAADLNGDGQVDIITGAGAGGGPHVRVWSGLDGSLLHEFFAYSPGFAGGVQVAAADVNGNGTPDIITGAGPGGGPHVRVFEGASWQELEGSIGSFFAYDEAFAGGVYVAAADVNGDNHADIITGAGAGGGPHVRVWSGLDGSLLHEFFAYSPGFAGGVQVAAADVNGNGTPDIITGAGPGGGPHVRVFEGASWQELGGSIGSFYAYDEAFAGGVYVAAAVANGDNHADIITGAGAGGGPHVRVLSGADGSLLFNFFAYSPQFLGGVHVAAADVTGNGIPDLMTGAGAGGGPHIRVFQGSQPDLAAMDQNIDGPLGSFFEFEPTYPGGIYIAGSLPSPVALTSGLALFSGQTLIDVEVNSSLQPNSENLGETVTVIAGGPTQQTLIDYSNSLEVDTPTTGLAIDTESLGIPLYNLSGSEVIPDDSHVKDEESQPSFHEGGPPLPNDAPIVEGRRMLSDEEWVSLNEIMHQWGIGNLGL